MQIDMQLTISTSTIYILLIVLQHCTNQAKKEPSTKVNVLSKSNKWGYAKQEDGFKKHDKNTTGLYHLGTINLPQQLEKNLNEYLRSKRMC